MSNKKTIPLLYAVMATLFICSCGNNGGGMFTQDDRHAADSSVRAARTLSAIDSTYKVMERQDDLLGKIVALREWGKLLRNESRFDEALEKHGEGLRLAEQADDTLEAVQALNNIGTDYRRMGVLDAAQQYHKRALLMSEECSDTSFTARKNVVMSLNGLANVYITVGNSQKADSCLRQALAGETRLGSLTGQAINCANLGSIFETRGQTDSAWAYYRKSMELNTRDGNTLGIALCHTYFGNLYKKARLYDKALDEYKASYNIMKGSKDEWHTLNALTALADIHIEKGNDAAAKHYLAEAKGMADKIHSTEHLSEIYNLYYKIKKRNGDWRDALEAHEHATVLQDSLIDMEKVNRMQSISFNIERDQYSRRMTIANDKLRSEKSARMVGYAIFAVIVALLAALVGLLIYNRRLRAKSFESLKKLSAMREAFFRNITHEFRTPLTVILGLSHDLQQPGTTTDEAQDVGKTIERQGERMLALINQLLDLSKIKSAIGKPEWRSGNIVAYIGMIVENFANYADKQGIKLQYIAREKSIDTDFVPDYVNKVLSNLLSNALKFTDRHGTVNISLWRSDRQLFMDVADNGRGIPAESLPHIFEEFYNSDNINGDVGTGVGLALVYQIVKSLGGTITADSTEGKGTTFHICLPMHKEANTPEVSNPSLSQILPAASCNGRVNADSQTEMPETPRVLIVEDNVDIAAYTGRQLADKYAVAFAANGKEGIEKARGWMPDIIITDLMMPEMDGMELCRHIHNNELTSHIPIIVITAKVTEAERIEGLKAGADAYLAKPFNSDELRTRVEMLLEQRRKLRERVAKETSNPSIVTDDKSPQISVLDSRFLNKVTDCVYVMLNGRKTIDVNAVASQLCMSYGQFNRKLSALTGYSPAQYIQRIKIKKAQRMLEAHPELGFNDIAYRCGFSDYSNFVRAFKNVCGITSTQFVRSVNNIRTSSRPF